MSKGIALIEIRNSSQERQRDEIEDFKYTVTPLLLLFISRRYGAWYTSKINWSDGKEESNFVSAIETMPKFH